MSYYKRHLFFCLNTREDGSQCCAQFGTAELRKYAKERTKELGISGPGGVRVNIAGCLGRCEEGPVAVVYPEEVWYSFVDEEDVEEIVTEHLVHGRVVERLKI
ncbi:MAG: 2Fe-2S ferredoxin [Gammaproteobacteria bacterium SG8_47]|nr:MAG: 2Fe-2S ferredoxin [Gammaproteobacteria bacterium SG8_47]